MLVKPGFDLTIAPLQKPLARHGGARVGSGERSARTLSWSSALRGTLSHKYGLLSSLDKGYRGEFFGYGEEGWLNVHMFEDSHVDATGLGARHQAWTNPGNRNCPATQLLKNQLGSRATRLACVCEINSQYVISKEIRHSLDRT
jgi:hypothetical protein